MGKQVKSPGHWFTNKLVKSPVFFCGIDSLHWKMKIKGVGRTLALPNPFTFHFLCPWRVS